MSRPLVLALTLTRVYALSELARLEGVSSGFASARDGIDALLRDRGLRRTGSEVTVESLLRGAHASAVLAGSSASLDELREAVADDVASAAVRVSAQLLPLASVVTTAPLQAFARVHALAAGGAEGGRPRDADAARLLGDLGRDVLAAPPRTPALLVAAVVHAEIATREPFGTYDGLVARALERLVLVGRGVDPTSLTVPEAGHLANRAAYASNLRGYRDGGLPGAHSWLLYAAEAYAAGAEASPLRA